MERGVRGFDWDEANEEHVRRHGVTPREAEEVFTGPLYLKRVKLGRYAVFGRTATGRLLILIVLRWAGGIVRVITARDMTQKEWRLYQRRRK